jgi:hypothetical protein
MKIESTSWDSIFRFTGFSASRPSGYFDHLRS